MKLGGGRYYCPKCCMGEGARPRKSLLGVGGTKISWKIMLLALKNPTISWNRNNVVGGTNSCYFTAIYLLPKINISILVCVYFHPVPLNRQKLTKYWNCSKRTWRDIKLSWPPMIRFSSDAAPFNFLLSQNHRFKLKWMLSNTKITTYVGI